MKAKEKIIVIDDNADIRATLSLFLNEIGFKTETAQTGQEAINKINKEFYNVALLDIKLPDIEGTKLLKPLKEKHPDMDVILMTGDASLDSAVEALNEGASGYIIKPLNLDNLLTNLKNSIEKQHLLIDKRKVERALRKSQQVLNLKNRISAIFLTIPDEQVYGEVLSLVLKELKSKYGVFGYIDENGDFICPSMTRNVWDKCDVPNKDIIYHREDWSSGNTIWGRTLISGEYLYLNKPFKVPKGHISINRALAAPINYRDKVIGLILVGNKKTDYNDNDVKLLESITEYISPILYAKLQRDHEEKQHKQAEDKLKETEKKVKTLNDSFLKFGDDPIRNIQILVDTVGKLLNADSALYNRIIEIKEKKILKTIAIYQEPPGNEREDDPLGHICTDVIRQNKDNLVIIKDLDKTKYGRTDPGVRKYNLKQYCGYIVRLNNKPVGSFCVVYLKNRELTETDKNIIKMLAKSVSIEEQRLNAQQKLKNQEHDLGERVKELTCLFNISRLIEDTEISMEQFFTKLLTFIPPAWQFPEVTCARITCEGRIFKTKNFQESQWEQIVEIKENGKKVGTLEVIYFEEMPEFDEGPFLKEERNLINALAEILGRYTERKIAEQKLKESEERYRVLFESSPVGIGISDFNGNVYNMNRKLENIIGFTVKELNDFKLNSIYVDQNERKKLLNILQKYRKVYDYQVKLKHKNGTIFLAQLNFDMIELNGKKLWLTSCEDITERKKAEDIINSLAKFPSENPNPVLRVNKEEVIYTNKTGQILFEIEEGDKTPKLLKDLVIKVIRTNKIKTTEIELNDHIYSFVITPITEEKYVNVHGMDITERKKTEQEIKESEAKFRALFENTNDAIFIHDKGSQFIEINQTTCERLGYTREELLKLAPKDLIPPGYKIDLQANIKTLQEKGELLIEAEHLTKDGDKIPVEINSRIFNFGGKNTIISVARDITERKLAERVIHDRNKEILMLLDASRAVLQYSDFEIAQKRIFNCCNNLIGADAGYVAVLNPSKKEYHKIFINPGSLTCEVDPDLPMPIRGMLAKVIKSKKILTQNDFSNTDWINFLPKGHIPLKNVLIVPLIINNEVNGMMGLTRREGGFTDEEARIATEFAELASISLFNSQTLESLEKSEQKYRRLSNILEQKVEERTIELKESEEKVQNMITNISDVLMEAKASGILTYISPQIKNIIGYQLEELIGLNFMDFIHLEDLSAFKETADKSLKTKKTVSIECRLKHKKGYFVPVSVKWSMVEINNEFKVFGLVSDNTERKKIDKMIKREIKQLKELDQIRNDLIRRISHELNTPLISILNGSQFLLDSYNDQMSDEAKDIVRIINQGGYRLKEMVNNLITAYELETDQIQLNIKQENLIPIVRECVEEIIFQADKRKIFINIELSNELNIDIDRRMIKKVILNLLSNAVKNTLANGNIFIKSIGHHNFIELIISDTGVGLTKKEKLLLFKKFGKIERFGKGMDVDIEGPGLGLYISSEIVKLHKGEILVKSKGRNKGSTFIIRLFLS